MDCMENRVVECWTDSTIIICAALAWHTGPHASLFVSSSNKLASPSLISSLTSTSLSLPLRRPTDAHYSTGYLLGPGSGLDYATLKIFPLLFSSILFTATGSPTSDLNSTILTTPPPTPITSVSDRPSEVTLVTFCANWPLSLITTLTVHIIPQHFQQHRIVA